jgi:hypothetical protein
MNLYFQILPERVSFVIDCYYSHPPLLWLPAFLRPDRLFPAVVQTHVKHSFQDAAEVTLTYEVFVFLLCCTDGCCDLSLFRSIDLL